MGAEVLIALELLDRLSQRDQRLLAFAKGRLEFSFFQPGLRAAGREFFPFRQPLQSLVQQACPLVKLRELLQMHRFVSLGCRHQLAQCFRSIGVVAAS